MPVNLYGLFVRGKPIIGVYVDADFGPSIAVA